MFERSKELALRPAAVESARSFLEMLRKTVNAWDAIKPWVNATDKATLLSQVLLAVAPALFPAPVCCLSALSA